MKSYEVKLYSRNGTWKKTINPLNIVSEISFSEDLEGGQGDLSMEIMGEFSDFLATDIVEIREVDEDNKEISPTYTGIVEEISVKEFTDGSTVNIQLLGLFTIMNDLLFKSGGNRKFTLNLTPGNLVKAIIDSFNTDYGTLSGGQTQTLSGNIIKYTGSSIDTSGDVVSIEFDNDTCLEAIEKTLKDTGFSFYIGVDGVCYVKKDEGQTKVSLTMGRQVMMIDRKLHKRELTNYLYHERTGSNEQIYTDPVSIALFGKKEKKIVESEIKDAATQNTKGQKYIQDYGYERNEIEITVKPMKTTSILPGNLITINNLKIPLVDKKVTKITKAKDSWTINVGDFISFGSTVLKK